MVRIFFDPWIGKIRKIFGPVCENGCWRRRKISEIYTLNDEQGVGKFIKFGRIRWVGHVMRITQSDHANKVFCNKPGQNGDRRGRRPKFRW
jgi:hypothetical protein